MNAPADLGARTIAYLARESIIPSETELQKLRRARILAAPAALEELAASIKADGMHLPLIVRPLATLPKMKPSYELIAGERRWRAAEIAGLSEVPAIVRELDDRQALRLQIAENLQRESLSALEEAEGYRALMASEDLRVEALVDVVGKSRAWIYDRLKLLDLPPEGREALLAGKLDPYLALVVARVHGKKQQAKALKLALEPGQTVRMLKHRVTGPGFTMNLAHASFPIDIIISPRKGPCTTCPDRTANGTEFDPEDDDPNVCTDVECFQAKTREHGEAAAELARDMGERVLTGAAALEIAPKPGVLLGHLDLYAVNDDDEFPEEEPKHDAPEHAAWEERWQAWEPRRWHQILTPTLEKGESLEPVFAVDPDDGRLRELIPVDRARRLLKRIKLELPSWMGEAPTASQSYQPPTQEEVERHQREQQAQREKQARELGERAGQEPRTHAIDEPVPTVAASGHIQLARAVISPCTHQDASNRARGDDQPLPTITGANRGDLTLAQPFISLCTHGNERNVGHPVSAPIGTVTTAKGGEMTLATPAIVEGYYIDILYRMLHWTELARATSFEDEGRVYQFTGKPTEIVKQIGNAVPIRTGAALCAAALDPMRIAA